MNIRCMGCMKQFNEEFGVCPHCGYVIGTPGDEATHMPPGSLLQDRYIVGKVLGFGGFGVTYIGWDGKLERRVAIKEYLPNEFSTRMPGRSQITVFSGDKREQFHSGMKKFVEEARNLAKFQSESGIATVYDSFEENDTAYIIMEYLDGETLSSYLERNGTIPEDEAVEMLRPVMESLEVVHAQGMVHRDIAPDNIFLTKEGDVKLIDFGAARYATTTHSRSLTVIVKPGYSPEEQYRSRGDQGPHTDVYALGSTLYKMITGKRPPDAMERRTKYENKNQDILIPPHKLNRKISVNRENAILNAMNVRIEDRTPTMAKFMQELDADPPAKRVYGKIKKLNFYAMPLWLKIGAPAAVLCLAILTGLMLSGVISFSNFSDELIVPEGVCIVPDVEGMQKEEALKIIEREQLQAGTAGTVKSKHIPAGKIVLQDPVGNAYLQINETVYLTVSSGGELEKGKVPYVVWDPLKEAVQKLKKVGMGDPIIKKAYDDHVTKGCVISQSIEAGETVEKGTRIKLTISKGPSPFTLSNVVGMTIGDATELLTSQGLLVTTVYEESNTVPDDCIIRQSVRAGADVQRGDEIVLTVSSREETIRVADVSGKTKEEASALLEEQGFEVSFLENFSEKVPAGCVISQNPEAGTEQMPGKQIVLYISKGGKPQGVKVADVLGMKEKSARAALEKQGFRVEVYEEYSTSAPKGTVFDQSPASGTAKLPGATIIIYVSQGQEVHPVSVPSVVGMSADDARSTLKKQGFQVEVYEEYHDSVGAGVVFDQSPGGDTSRPEGSMVEIYVSKGGRPVSVSFDGNGGNVDSASIVVRKGETYGDLPSASRTGYSFAGWYTAPDGGSRVEESTTVSNGNGHTLYAHWTVNSYTYRVLYRSTNGTDLGSSEETHEYNSVHTVSAPGRGGYHTPGAQEVRWDSTDGKDIVFYYKPAGVSNGDRSGKLSDWTQSNHTLPTISYKAQFGVRNRTANSVEIKLTITETIKKSFFCNNVRRVKATVGDTLIGDIMVVDSWEWSGQTNHDRTKTAETGWVRVPIGTTDATTVVMDGFFYETNQPGTHLQEPDGDDVYLSWKLNIPAY